MSFQPLHATPGGYDEEAAALGGTPVAEPVALQPGSTSEPLLAGPLTEDLLLLSTAAGNIPMYGPASHTMYCEGCLGNATPPAPPEVASYLTACASEQVLLFCEGDGEAAHVRWVVAGHVRPRPELQLPLVPLGALQAVPLDGRPLLALLYTGTAQCVVAPPSLPVNLMRAGRYAKLMNARWGQNRHFATARQGIPRGCRDNCIAPPGLTVLVDPATLRAKLEVSSTMMCDSSALRLLGLILATLFPGIACLLLAAVLEIPYLGLGYFAAVGLIIAGVLQLRAAGETDTREVRFWRE